MQAKADKYGYVSGFVLAGSDKKFCWAQAWIEGDKVFVTSKEVNEPVAVRYAWADNPDDANLFNKGDYRLRLQNGYVARRDEISDQNKSGH